MPARHFTRASTEFIRTSLGATGFAFGPGTGAAIVRPTQLSTANICIFSAGASNAVNYRFVVGTNGVLNLATNNTGVSGVTAITVNKWYCLGWSKATGTVAPRFHIYDYAANTWVHENSASTLANSSVPITRADIGVAAVENNFAADADIAVVGVWNVVLTDAQFELLAYDRMGWFNIQPKGLWELDQDAVTQKVIDQSGGGANESSRTGTTLGTSSVPVFSRGAEVVAA